MVVRAHDGSPDGEIIGDIQPKYNGIEPGGIRPIKIPWRPLEGDHTIYLVVMPQDPSMVLDFNDENNITRASLMVTDEPDVDLMVEELYFLMEGAVTTLASQGQSVHIVATIANDGTGNFHGAIEVGIYRGDPDAGGIAIGLELLIADIGPQETITIEFDWRVALGTHAITIFVDPGNMVYESNEFNNQLGKGLTVTRQPLPDLTIASMDLLLNGVPVDPEVGSNEGANVEVNITVWNSGNEKTKSAIVTSLFLGNPEMGDELEVASFTVAEGLNPDEVFVHSLYWTAEKPKQKGKIPILFVQVDTKGIEPEVTEFNNIELRPLTVGIKLPDLTVIEISLTNTDKVPVSSMTYGTSIDITIKTTNIGTDISFRVAQLSLFLDTVDPGNRITAMSTSTMGIGETITKTHNWSPDPSKVKGGDHIIIAVIDPSGEIEESSDANNNLSVPIHIDADALPNLLLQDMWVTKGDRVVDSLDKGDKGTVHLRILNLGEAPLFTSTAVELFHGDPTQGGESVASWPIKDLPVDGNVSFEIDWTFEKNVPLMVFIDRNHMVEETNEQDNFGTAEITVNEETEGADWLIIGVMLALGVVALLAVTALLRRNPTRPRSDVEEPEEDAPVEESPEEDAPVEESPEEDAPAEESPEEDVPEGSPEEEASEEAATAPTCPNCGKELDPAWILCPFCDKPLY